MKYQDYEAACSQLLGGSWITREMYWDKSEEEKQLLKEHVIHTRSYTYFNFLI